jgi:hypothetical protein
VTTAPTNPLAAEPTHGYSSDHLEDNRRVIANYRYRDAGDHWDAIAPFVRTTVSKLAHLPTRVIRTYLTTLSKFAMWALTRGLPIVNADDIVTPANIYRFDAEVLVAHTDATRRNERDRLKTLLKRIGDDDPSYPRKIIRTDIRPSLHYYREDEQIAFVSSSETRNTARQRNNMKVLLGLGFGAGLTAREISDALVGDIVEDLDCVRVHVRGKNSRVVPVRAQWSGLLVEGLGVRPADDVAIDGYRRTRKHDALIYHLSKEAPNEPTPNASQMRATWIIEHVLRGLRPDVVATIAGTSLDAIGHYLHRMPRFDLDDFLEQIVGDAA